MKKYKIGYTTGVFDLFHVGHLRILQRAKQQCECLIVGVSTDDLVLSYKNKLPIIPFDERIEIVRAIKYVDRVVEQTTMDKLQAYNNLHFDAIFHGSDWQNSDMYNSLTEQFEPLGVDIVFLPHTEGVSSTQLAEELCKGKQQL